MRVLVACERSGRVRSRFRAQGHDAWSADLFGAEDRSPHHYKGDVLKVLGQGWDLLIAHPPCTRLANSGVWALDAQNRWGELDEAVAFFNAMLDADVPKVCVENPIMHKHAAERIRRPYTQIVQPWQFGDDASKATCLWLKGLPPLVPTNVLPGGRAARRANQTKSGQNKESPSPHRQYKRSLTYNGIADAMAEQWGKPSGLLAFA